MDWLAAVVLVLVLVVVIAVIMRRLPSKASAPEYVRRRHFLSAAERSFLGVLDQAVGDGARILTKVRIADVLQPARGGSRSDWQRAFNRISSKHFDYLLCDPASLEPRSAIELNDRSHGKRDRRARDAFVADACRSAGLPLFTFDAKRAYSVAEVRLSLAADDDRGGGGRQGIRSATEDPDPGAEASAAPGRRR